MPDVHQLAHMRVYMQIPVNGTEFSRPETRAKQASVRSHDEVDAFAAFYQHASKNTPALLAMKHGKQPENGLVPDGYVVFLVWEQVPGSLLGNGLSPRYANPPFWQLPLDQRNEIRDVFKQEYPKLLKLGFRPTFGSLDNLVWDSNLRKL
ncbi:hypothetical protein PHISP_06011 [Aspergillus sp. HF37]|nr:hypothetical protein PHISP_06011 [Aspergillus sp. HF37]